MSVLNFTYFSDVKNGKLQANVSKTIAADLKRFEGKRIELSIKKLKSTRSGQQNRFLHATFTILTTELNQTKKYLSNMKNKHNEDNIQRSIIMFFKIVFPESIIFSIPNGGRRNVIEAANLKRSGVLAGVSDLIVLHEGTCYFFEVKQPKGKQTDNQKEFETRVKEQGFEYHIICSFNDLETILNKKI